jgi:serpin B
VPMMMQKEQMRLYQNDQVQVVWRDFTAVNSNGPLLEAMIVVPRNSSSLQTTYSALSAEKVKEWQSKAAMQQVELYLPKCSLRSRASLKAPLQAIGIKEAFTAQADFSGISPASDLMVDDVLHEAYMKIDEAGVEATGATAVTMMMKAAMPPKEPPVVVRCDKPYFVFIKEKSTGLILFISLIAAPEKI